ncbi:MAG: helix-turn-helix domain-containing protein [Thiohalocapsa sp.]|jgi:transcriptional regulator with XRE-family HTH domain|nr:helix-turn-helix domain-containing protein [Thiohalocapsa sp.]MCF7992745.1 helix-turn-helix domain-containing protein [Thiohalocapsa sp.]
MQTNVSAGGAGGSVRTLTEEIGSRLREARKVRGLSLSQLSACTNGALSKSRISNYEQGLRRMGVEEARMLSEALGTVSGAYLLCLDEDAFLNDAEERLLLDYFRRADMRGRAAILSLAQVEGGRSKAAS